MNDALLTDDDILALIDLRATLAWLATPPPAQAEEDLAPLHAHLTAVRDTRTAPVQRRKVLDMLDARAKAAVRRLLPEIVGVSLPLSRRSRQTVRGMQTLLLMLAEDHLQPGEDIRMKRSGSDPLSAWRALDALAGHLLISGYAGAPYGPGVWKMAHRIYRTAADAGYASAHIREAGCTIEDTYLRACLLACAQPASFTSREIALVVDYIARFSSRAVFIAHAAADAAEGVFWIDPDRDAPPTSAGRRPAPAGALCFACERLAQLAEEQVDALQAGARAAALDLPESADTPAGHGVLRRLAHRWGHPGKRRFPRRRQNYRAELCIGLGAVRALFDGKPETDVEPTQWMVTNESPDGYAVMHVAGKTGRLAAGDAVAVRSENKADWQVCIVRWAQSENPEHLELGLQIVATHAIAATLVTPGDTAQGRRWPVLALPALPPIRPDEALLAPTGTAAAGAQKLILLIERENLEIREIRATGLGEQTAAVELITFVPDEMP